LIGVGVIGAMVLGVFAFATYQRKQQQNIFMSTNQQESQQGDVDCEEFAHRPIQPNSRRGTNSSSGSGSSATIYSPPLDPSAFSFHYYTTSKPPHDAHLFMDCQPKKCKD